MTSQPKRWSVRKRNGQWRIYDHGTWADVYDTLPEAHTAATQNAVTDVLWAPGGLTMLRELIWARQQLWKIAQR